ncbi:MAG: AEC family transporter [Ruminiclostridium sp.]
MGAILIKAISLILVIVIGNLIKRAGWVSVSDFPKFSKIVLRITLPCALITSFNEFKITNNLLVLTAIGIGVNLIQQLTGYLVNLNNGRKEQSFGILNIGSYNIGAFAMPYISGFIGPKSIIFASFFDIGNSISAAGLGYGYVMSIADENQKTTVVSFIKSMLKSPIFDTYLFLLIMRLMDLSLPEAVIDFTSTVGSANTFLAMLMIGIGLELRLDTKKYKLALKYLGIRYSFALIFTAVVVFFLPFPEEIKVILCMLFFSPVAAMITGFTSDIEGDVETSAFINSLSIIIGIVIMPLILIIMGK